MSGPCVVEGCPRPAHARSMCGTHWLRWRKHGDPSIVGERTGRPLKGEHPTWAAVHKRLTRTRGPAAAYACTDCGGAAREWSYDNADPAELIGRVGSFDCAYSLDLSHYSPRCVSCHRKYDQAGNRPRSAEGRFMGREEVA